ncbi:MAG: hypothetical protein R3F62_17475 [Planctomycetota bacterium]
MSSTTAQDSRTPGRRAGAPSVLAGHHLAGRLAELPLPTAAIPRLTRLVPAEVDAALEADRGERFSLAEVEAAGADSTVLEALRKLRRDQERARALRDAGITELSSEQRAALLVAVKEGR